ncbi:MAG: hypothetical protein IPN03_08280 [Holophagales bacterium]|nr:hypothetical protein [Holophagales bacterium]
MPRIPDELLARIKQEVPLAELIGRRVALKPHGENLLGLCPNHPDKTPSLVVTPSKGLWHCMGACQTGGTAIDWVMKSEGVSFRHAADVLLSEFFALESSRLSPPKRSTVRTLASPVEPEASEEEAKRQVVAYYHETLRESPEALAYLERRGLTHPDLTNHFQLGFSNRTLGLRLPPDQSQGRLRDPDEAPEHRDLPCFRPRAFRRLSGHPRLRRGRQRRRDLRPPHRRPREERRTEAPLPPRSPSRRLQRRGAEGPEGSHPLRGPHRRPHLLVRRLPQRHGELRRRGLHDRSPGPLPARSRRACPHRLRPRRSRRQSRRGPRQEARRLRHRHLARPLPERDGRQRLRPQGDAAGEVSRPSPPQRRVEGRRRAAGGGRHRTRTRDSS